MARDLKKLKEKCDRSYGEPGFLSHYSFGLRYEIFLKFRRQAHTKRTHERRLESPDNLPTRLLVV